MIIDTNIVIDFLKERSEAIQFFSELEDRPVISVITVSELYARVRESERRTLQAFIDGSQTVAVNEKIALQAGEYLNQYQKSHGVRLGDALIAATATVLSLELVSLNAKHFPMLEGILVPYNPNKQNN